MTFKQNESNFQDISGNRPVLSKVFTDVGHEITVCLRCLYLTTATISTGPAMIVYDPPKHEAKVDPNSFDADTNYANFGSLTFMDDKFRNRFFEP